MELDKSMPQREVTITTVELVPRQKQRYAIYVEDGTSEPLLVVHEDSLIKFNLFKGRTLLPDQLAEVIAEDEKQRAYVAALHYISIKMRSANHVRSYLIRKEYSEIAVETTIERLEREHYVDDENYAERFAESRVLEQRKGRLLVEQELRQRGITKAMARDALGQIDEADEIKICLEVARKKWPKVKGESLRERKYKLMQQLQARGFMFYTIRQATTRMFSEHSELEQDELDSE